MSAFFFIHDKDGTFAIRRLPSIPRVGDCVVFNEVRYRVDCIEWCLDSDATDVGTRINVELVAKVEA